MGDNPPWARRRPAGLYGGWCQCRRDAGVPRGGFWACSQVDVDVVIAIVVDVGSSLDLNLRREWKATRSSVIVVDVVPPIDEGFDIDNDYDCDIDKLPSWSTTPRYTMKQLSLLLTVHLFWLPAYADGPRTFRSKTADHWVGLPEHRSARQRINATYALAIIGRETDDSAIPVLVRLRSGRPDEAKSCRIIPDDLLLFAKERA